MTESNASVVHLPLCLTPNWDTLYRTNGTAASYQPSVMQSCIFWLDTPHFTWGNLRSGVVLPGCAMVLGSAWSFAPITMLMATFIVRKVQEDGALRRELPGYEEYCTRNPQTRRNIEWASVCDEFHQSSLRERCYDKCEIHLVPVSLRATTLAASRKPRMQGSLPGP